MSSEREVAFLKLQEERLTALEKKRTDRKEANQSTQQLDEFLKSFDSLKSEIEIQLENVVKLNDTSEKKSLLNSALNKASDLQALLNDSLSFLPAYDLRRSQEAVTAIHQHIARIQQECVPKKKFAFGKKKNVTGNANTAQVSNLSAPLIDSKFSKYAGDVIFENKSNETLELQKCEIYKKDVLLKNLSNCTVNLHSTIGTLHCTNCENCTFSTGPISGSIFLENCNGSTYYVTCQQARVHTTNSAVFHIHVTSKAIIEDCKDLTFGERTVFYGGYDDDLRESGLSDTNNWNNVDDFNWLSNDPSPNWGLIS